MHEPPALSRLIVLASPKSHLETVASDRSDLRANASARAKKEGMSSMAGAWLMHPPPVKPSHGGPICLAQRRKMVDMADGMTLRRRIQQRLDALHEDRRVPAVDHPVVVGERERHHEARDEFLAVPHRLRRGLRGRDLSLARGAVRGRALKAQPTDLSGKRPRRSARRFHAAGEARGRLRSLCAGLEHAGGSCAACGAPD